MTHFYFLPCRDWTAYNLTEDFTDSNKDHYISIFMISCWHLWNWRNKTLFEEGFQLHDNPTGTIIHLVKHIKAGSRVRNKLGTQG